MKEPKFTTEDIVQLRAGGPRMTIREIMDGNKYKCEWFDKTKLKSEIFIESQLQIWEDEPDILDIMLD